VPGWQLIMRTEARAGRPVAVKGIQDQAQGVLWTRALRMPTPAKVAGAARRRPPGFYTRCGDGVDLRWLDPQGITGVVRANAKRALTADTRAQATAAEGMSIGGWAHEVDDDADRIFPGGAPHVNSPPVSRFSGHRRLGKRTVFLGHWVATGVLESPLTEESPDETVVFDRGGGSRP
jgi:hypothetical protein